jgi:preprotein translocase subunit SecG
MKKQTQIIQILVMLIVLLTPMILMAQPQENPYGAGGGEPSSAPIDGGLSLLVAAGVGYGAKKLKEKRNKALQPKGE